MVNMLTGTWPSGLTSVQIQMICLLYENYGYGTPVTDCGDYKLMVVPSWGE